MKDYPEEPEGLRCRKKRETLRRIAETGLELFLRNGYDATTLDDIALEAGIARRTFFYYFKSKEAILLAYIDGGFALKVKPELPENCKDLPPLQLVKNIFQQVFSSHDNEKALAVYKLLESTEALRSRLQTVSSEMEKYVFQTLCEIWPDQDKKANLRMVAVVAIGALRVAKEAWRDDEGRYPLANYIDSSFNTLGQLVRD